MADATDNIDPRAEDARLVPVSAAWAHTKGIVAFIFRTFAEEFRDVAGTAGNHGYLVPYSLSPASPSPGTM